MTSKELKTTAMAAQVGGHPGVLTSEDGSLLIKPALAQEVNFYQHVAAEQAFAPLRPFLPKFIGTLTLAGQLADPAGTTVEPVEHEQKDIAITQSIVLENLAHLFARPNILDIKLGTVLYDDDASPEKKARMEKTARETTSLTTGVRLTGFQVHDNTTLAPVVTAKSYGKSITPADLPDGIARFFPLATTGLGLPAPLLLPILERVRADVADIRAALAAVEMRMVGGSVLIIYEADPARAEHGLEHYADEIDEDEDDDDEEDAAKVGPAYVVKLIDFAHTKIAPGLGPDAGVLLGLDTVLRLLDARIADVKAAPS